MHFCLHGVTAVAALKPGPAEPAERDRERLHGVTAVAALKQPPPGQADDVAAVSTASLPWPH